MSGEKTEEPTHKKLEDERRKGNVPKSKDVAATLSLISLLAYLIAAMPFMLKTFSGLFNKGLESVANPEWSEASDLIVGGAMALAWASLPFLAVGTIMVIVGYMMQFGFLLSFEALQPKPDKFNPATNLQQMFSPDALFEFLMSLIKLIVLGYIFYVVASRSVGALVSSLHVGWRAVMPVLSVMLKETVLYFATAFMALAAADYAFRRFHFNKKNKMSKDEVKREYKESEGDPHIKHKRKQLHEEMIENAIVERTRDASVLIVNPTHFAVALYYDENGEKLPLVLGKGEGRLAQKMIKAAEEAGIPIMRDVPLARGLYAESVVDHQIPVSFIKPVAETLKWARKFRSGAGGGASPSRGAGQNRGPGPAGG